MHDRSAVRALYLSLALAGGCTDRAALPAPEDPGSDVGDLTGPFVPLYREVSGETTVLRQSALTIDGGNAAPLGQDFYLAIRRSDLGQRWFLSAYLTQALAGAAGGAAQSLGTRVVSFQIQNGKLFMFDVADDKAWSDTFRPELVIEAYPIVTGYDQFERRAGAREYVLIDPAAGLNRFRLLQDGGGFPLAVDLSFSQRFRAIPDGATFDQVFTGSLDVTVVSDGVSIVRPHFAGTMSLGLRRYSEGEGYQPTALPAQEHYVRSPPRVLTNEGTEVQVAAKWNLQPGGKPISWVIAGLADRLRSRPELADVDFTGAIKAGIESWNEAFGWHALDAQRANDAQSFGDDDVNYFIMDADRSYTAAFADLRNNPNTGETRGASIYLPLGRLAPALAGLTAPATPRPGDETLEVVETSPRPQKLALGWSNAGPESLCDLPVLSLDEVLAAEPPPGLPPLTAREKVERYVGYIAAHETGHTLGLRHNFKGSLRPPTSSLMEYAVDSLYSIIGPHIQSYDVAAIRYLYGLSPELPEAPFCTDDRAQVDPDCRRGDAGATPLTDFFIPVYTAAVMPFLRAQTNRLLLSSIDDMLPHFRLAVAPADRLAAYDAVMAPIRAPLVPPPGAPPSFGARADLLTQIMLRRLFVDPLPPLLGLPVPLPPPTQAPVLVPAAADLEALLVNGDRLRSFTTRRLAADILKKAQSAVAYLALARAREAIAAQAPPAGDTAVETRDLLGRIDRYLAAYFD